MQQLGSKIGVVVAGAAGVGAAYVFNQHQQARKKTNDQRLHAAYATEWHGHAIAPTWLPNHVSPQAWVAQLSDEQKRREAVRKQIAAEAERVRLSLSNAKYKELEAKEQLSHVRSSLQRDANAFAAWQRVEAENAEKIKIELIAVARMYKEPNTLCLTWFVCKFVRVLACDSRSPSGSCAPITP